MLHAMFSADYQERLWESVPEGSKPPALEADLAFVSAHVRVLEGARILDVGCGEAHLAERLVRAGASVLGLDPAEEPLRRARRRVGELDLDLRRIDPDGPWPVPDASFQALWAGHVIERLRDTIAWLAEARRVLTAEGLLLLATPDHPLPARLALLAPGAFERRFDPRSDVLRFYTARSLRAVLQDAGFQAILIAGESRPRDLGPTLRAAARRAGP